MIDIITYCDQNQNLLKELFFKPSYNLYLKKFFKHIDIVFDNNKPNNGGFGSKVFQDIIFDRWKILIEHIKKNPNANKFSIFSDIDIIFLGDIKQDISSLFKNKNIDIYFMSESCKTPVTNFNINAGFFIFRHSLNTIKFFEHIIQFMSKQKVKEDQIYIRKTLQKKIHSNIKLLDPRIFNTNNCKIEHNLHLIQNNTLKVFHATSCLDIYKKIHILSQISSHIRQDLLNSIYKNR